MNKKATDLDVLVDDEQQLTKPKTQSNIAIIAARKVGKTWFPK